VGGGGHVLLYMGPFSKLTSKLTLSFAKKHRTA